jgi:hypothetical protein
MLDFRGINVHNTALMKRNPVRGSFRRLLLLAAVFFGLPMLVAAQGYSVNWYKIAGGGGTSTNGAFSVSGTIGQHDTGHMSGGPYTVDAGFWAIIAPVQTAGAPYLTLVITNHVAVLSWPGYPAGFNLQETTPLMVTNQWQNVNITPSVLNDTNYVTVPATGSMFFRLMN